MKKIFALIITLALLFTLAACGSDSTEDPTPVNLDDISLADIVAQTADGSELTFYSFTTENVDNDTAAYLIGASAIDTPFTEAVAYVPTMNTNPFTMIVFRVSDVQDAQSLADELLAKADLCKLICVDAEMADTVVNGSTVLFIMGSQSEVDAVIGAFDSIA